MSTYPGAVDSFPTHVNTTEFVDSSHINNLQAAVVAVETILGINPQGSYATVVAWLNALNTSVAAGLSLDTAAADIRPVGTTAAAGGIGKAADAGHIHVGVTSLAMNGGAATSGVIAFSLVNSIAVNGGAPQTGTVSITTLNIDTTASDIQPVGVAPAAGSQGQAADAKHVHPMNVLQWMSM